MTICQRCNGLGIVPNKSQPDRFPSHAAKCPVCYGMKVVQ